MAFAKPTAEEEASFMSDLLSGLDDSFFDAVPSPDPTPRKRSKPPTSHFVTPQMPKKVNSPFRSRGPASQVYIAENVDLDALTAGMETYDWNDTNPDFSSPVTKNHAKDTEPPIIVTPAPPYSRDPCTRCIVEGVSDVPGNGRPQKKLLVRVDKSDERRSVTLHDDWSYTDVRVGDTVNVLGAFVSLCQPSVMSNIDVNSKANFLILHPDLLLTATALSNTLKCRRKPLLANLVRSSTDITPSLIWGNMLHEVMQTCLTLGRWEDSWIQERINDVVINGLAELVKIEVGVEQAKREVTSRAKGLRTFAEKYISNVPKPEAILTNTRSERNQTSYLAISQLHDFEEDIWSPTYGLKGKLDATVEAVISDPNFFSRKPFITSGPKPFEIKTGRTVAGMEHRAQTMLYTLLAAERYGVEVPSGLLYYTQTDEVVRVPASRNELRGLVGARNEMAGYMMRRNRKLEMHGDETAEESFLPASIDDERVCKSCNSLDLCMLYRKAVENVRDDSSPIADTYELKTSHLSPVQTAFFKKWEALITAEEQDMLRFKKELWTMGADEREAKGRCFGSMILDTSFESPEGTADACDSKIHRFTYRFVRLSHGKGDNSLLEGHMSRGDAVTISVEPHLLALARGFIVELTTRSVVVGLDHILNLNTIKARLSTAIDVSTKSSLTTGIGHVVFRVDKDELFGGMGRIRDNLAQLFYAEGDSRRLELVVDLKPPQFHQTERFAQLQDPWNMRLNRTQKQAVTKVLTAQDYALILGMPGTGKTTVIASIIQTLVSMNKTVLLTSYTHSAVDTILLKLKDKADFSILRLGNLDKIHPDVHEFTLAARQKATSVEQLERQLMTPLIVATTCLSIDHALFSRRTFDYCIVDEASQITLPVCLGPLRFADKFVLVGDHFQLPPLVRSRSARKGGLDISLFRRLSDAHPHAVIDLTYQYRMNEDIMFLSNKLIYSDRLRCGSDEVAKRTLAIPNAHLVRDFMTKEISCSGKEHWMERLLSERCKAIFVDTDLVPAPDSRVGDLVQNEVEATLVYQVAETLLHCGILQEQIGIISLYRQQIKLLTHLLQHRKEMEILTADRSQGRDKDCIIISMVRSNDAGEVGDLVKDWRRINVSFTRARSKLIIFGSRRTLRAAPILAEFLELMEAQEWICNLPPRAHASYSIQPASLSYPRKRTAQDLGNLPGKENVSNGAGPKKLKPLKRSSAESAGGIANGRPILRDLIVSGAY